MPGVPLLYSKSQVNRAGDIFRHVTTRDSVAVDELMRAIDVLNNFRAVHEYALIKANMGLRSMVRTAACRSPRVSQRLKRRSTIIDKLRREPSMALSRMQDIGGARAVLGDLDEVNRVFARLRHNGKVQRHKDYIADPAPSGYRSLHVIVTYDDRLIEVQLRTTVQHEWAFTVERLGGRIDQDIKGGEGPREIHNFLRAISEAMALEESGGVVDKKMHEELRRLREIAEPFLGLGRPDR